MVDLSYSTPDILFLEIILSINFARMNEKIEWVIYSDNNVKKE